MIKVATDKTIYQEIENGDTVLIEFCSGFSMPSTLEFENLKVVNRRLGDKIVILTLNVFDYPAIAKDFKIVVLPTTIVYKQKHLTDRVHGYMPLDKINYMLARYIKE